MKITWNVCYCWEISLWYSHSVLDRNEAFLSKDLMGTPNSFKEFFAHPVHSSQCSQHETTTADLQKMNTLSTKKHASRSKINAPLLLGSHEWKLGTRISSSPLYCTLLLLLKLFFYFSKNLFAREARGNSLNTQIGRLHHRHSAIFIPSWFAKGFKASFMWIYFFSIKTAALQGVALIRSFSQHCCVSEYKELQPKQACFRQWLNM